MGTPLPKALLPPPGATFDVAEGAEPTEAVASLLRYAREVARATSVVLVIPPEQGVVLAEDADAAEGRVCLDEGVEVVWRGAEVLAVETFAASASPALDPERARLLLRTVTGGFVAEAPSFREEEAPARIAFLQGLAVLASACAAWAARLLSAERRAADAESERMALREDCARLRELANVDDLTGLSNRRFFERQLAQEIQRFRRYRHPLSLALVDVDRFKRVNDVHGHVVGDAALRLVAEVARRTMREADLVARIGGDEIAVLMPDTSHAGALVAAERLRIAVSRAPLPVDAGVVSVRISVGVASVASDEGADGSALLRRADEALYRAKEGGRDRVVGSADAGDAEAPRDVPASALRVTAHPGAAGDGRD